MSDGCYRSDRETEPLKSTETDRRCWELRLLADSSTRFEWLRALCRQMEFERDAARHELAEARQIIRDHDAFDLDRREELESLRRDKARLDWIFAVINTSGTRGFSKRVSWRYPGITREDVDAAMQEGTP